MKRFRLTIVFVLFSALTIGAGAIAVNSLTASSAERSLLSLTEAQSERDARFIATLVSQLLTEDAAPEPVSVPLQGAPTGPRFSPAFGSTSLQVNAATVLKALDIADLAIYSTEGEQLWSSTEEGTLQARPTQDSLSRALNGEIVSGILEEGVAADGSEQPMDLVATFVPLVGETSGKPIQVLAVSRAVPAGVAALVEESRATVFKTTLISLSGVFLILLVFVLIADVRIWRRNARALSLEREQHVRLGRRNRQLSNENESKARFISAISHELSNPLTSLVSFLDLVLRNRDGNLTDRQIEQLSTARRNGQQMGRLVSDLAHASRSSIDTLEIVYDQFDIRPVLDEVAESISHDLEARRQELNLECEHDLGTMTGDRGRLVQVFSNLVSNASKYSPNERSIWLKAEINEECLCVEVIDEGIGISEEDQRHIFEMFWRAENPSVEGAGIGLVLAKQIVEGHGGTLEVSSVLGEGTTFSFKVPLQPADADAIEQSPAEREKYWGQAA